MPCRICFRLPVSSSMLCVRTCGAQRLVRERREVGCAGVRQRIAEGKRRTRQVQAGRSVCAPTTGEQAPPLVRPATPCRQHQLRRSDAVAVGMLVGSPTCWTHRTGWQLYTHWCGYTSPHSYATRHALTRTATRAGPAEAQEGAGKAGS